MALIEVTPTELAIYQSCPRKYQFNKLTNTKLIKETIPFEEEVLFETIKSYYIYSAKHGKPPKWGFLVGQLSRLYTFAGIKLKEPISIEVRERTLLKLQQWYEKIVPTLSESGITNVPVKLNIESKVQILDSIPILGIGTKLQVFDYRISPEKYIPLDIIYNNIETQIRLWTLCTFIEREIDEYIEIVSRARSIYAIGFKYTREIYERANKMMKQILNGLVTETFYPIRNEHCEKCIWNSKCQF